MNLLNTKVKLLISIVTVIILISLFEVSHDKYIIKQKLYKFMLFIFK